MTPAILQRPLAILADGVMCRMMNSLQWRLRELAGGAEELEAYVGACEGLTREEFFRVEFPKDWQLAGNRLEGPSPWESPWVRNFPENQIFHADIFWAGGRPGGAPTLILLHALMSANARGYHRIAAEFNQRGWNVAFPHLPYHYRRKARRLPQGALCITADLVRNGETLRQAVQEIRALMAWLRRLGVGRFGLLGTSYGGWTGALTSFLEDDLEFLALLQPIANVEHAIWENPVSSSLRRILRERGIPREATPRHAHLSSPQHGRPCVSSDRILLCGGRFDSVSPVGELEELARQWEGAGLLVVPQGHFGYRAMRETLAHIRGKWLE